MQQTNRIFCDKRVPEKLRFEIINLFRPLPFVEILQLKIGKEIWIKFSTEKIQGYRRVIVMGNSREFNVLSTTAHLLVEDRAHDQHELVIKKKDPIYPCFRLHKDKNEGDIERLAASHPCASIPIAID